MNLLDAAAIEFLMGAEGHSMGIPMGTGSQCVRVVFSVIGWSAPRQRGDRARRMGACV